jgi:GAG-pre-integrase domain
VSFSQLKEDLNYIVIMYPNHYKFQDIVSGEMIGRDTKRNGMYYLKELKNGRACLTSEIGEIQKNKVLLWHKRKDHSSFGYMKKFLHIFLGLKDENFICKTCIKSKSHRNSLVIVLINVLNYFSLSIRLNSLSISTRCYRPVSIDINADITLNMVQHDLTQL